MKIYLCHNYSARGWLNNQIVPELTQLGHTITSRWLTMDQGDMSPESQKKYADMDLQDVTACNLLIHFADQYIDSKTPGRGKYIEVGYAMAIGRKIAVVGKDIETCVFYFEGSVERYTSFYDLLSTLRKVA